MPQLEKQFGSVACRATAPGHATVPTAPQPAQRQIVHRGHAGRRAVAGPHRLGRRAAIGTRLLPAAGAEHDPRRLVHVAPQSEPARGSTATRTAPARVSTCVCPPVRSLPAPACRPTRPRSRSASSSTSSTAIGKPIPADELAKAKNYVAFGFPSDFETIGDFSAQLEELVVYGLPDSYYADYVKNIQAVTAEAVPRRPRRISSRSDFSWSWLATAKRSNPASVR